MTHNVSVFMFLMYVHYTGLYKNKIPSASFRTECHIFKVVMFMTSNRIQCTYIYTESKLDLCHFYYGSHDGRRP